MTVPKRYRRCILANCCVPWNDHFDFEGEMFRNLVRLQIASGICDLYIFGTAGEGYAVSDRQFEEITGVFLDETRIGGAQSMVGIISQSLPTIIDRIERAHGFGARRFQISLPNWGVLRDCEMQTFFRETCGRFPDCGFLHYNLQRAGRILTGAEYGRLAAEHPNLIATKNSTADESRLRGLVEEAPELQHFITEFGFAKAALMGECGLLLSFASTNFSRAVDFFRAGCSRDATRLDAIAEEFDGLIATLRASVAETAHMDGAFDKMFCRVHDPAFPLRLLPPYESVSEGRFDLYVAQMRKSHPDWMP